MFDIARYSVFTDISEGEYIIYISPVKNVIETPYGCKAKECFIGKFTRELLDRMREVTGAEIICTF